MEKQTYTIAFENGSVANANRWARELKEMILDATTDVVVEQKRDNPHSMDLGTIVEIILGAQSVIAVATALGKWLTLHRQAGITVKTSQGEIVGVNLTSKDAMKLAELILAYEKRHRSVS